MPSPPGILADQMHTFSAEMLNRRFSPFRARPTALYVLDVGIPNVRIPNVRINTFRWIKRGQTSHSRNGVTSVIILFPPPQEALHNPSSLIGAARFCILPT